MERYGDDEKANPSSASEGPMITIGMGAPGLSLGGVTAPGQASVLAVDDELEWFFSLRCSQRSIRALKTIHLFKK